MQRQHAVVVLGSASRPGASQGLLRGVPAAAVVPGRRGRARRAVRDRKSTRLNSSHLVISYAVFCLKKKKKKKVNTTRLKRQNITLNKHNYTYNLLTNIMNYKIESYNRSCVLEVHCIRCASNAHTLR